MCLSINFWNKLIEAGFRRLLTKKAKKLTKIAFKKPSLTLKLSTIFLGLVMIFVGLGASQHTEAESLDSSSVLGAKITKHPEEFKQLSRPAFTVQSIVVAEQRKTAEMERLAAIKKAEEEKARHINRINTFLSKKRSPVANTEIAEIMYERYKTEGTDYKVLLAIMGVESGFCNASFHYNCFGYLNGAKYTSYEDAFTDLVPKVGAQYADKYGTDFESLAKAYGMVNWQAGAANMRGYYNSI